MRRAIHKALAVGYLAGSLLEGIEVRPDRTARDIWELWGRNTFQLAEDLGLPRDTAREVRITGSQFFIDDLKQLRPTRFLGGSKLNQLGMRYTNAGFLLRFTQTSAVADEDFDRAVRAIREQRDRPWRFEDYPVGGSGDTGLLAWRT